MFHIKNVNNKKNLTEERKIMRNCASEILIPTFINPSQNEACKKPKITDFYYIGVKSRRSDANLRVKVIIPFETLEKQYV